MHGISHARRPLKPPCAKLALIPLQPKPLILVFHCQASCIRLLFQKDFLVVALLVGLMTKNLFLTYTFQSVEKVSKSRTRKFQPLHCQHQCWHLRVDWKQWLFKCLQQNVMLFTSYKLDEGGTDVIILILWRQISTMTFLQLTDRLHLRECELLFGYHVCRFKFSLNLRGRSGIHQILIQCPRNQCVLAMPARLHLLKKIHSILVYVGVSMILEGGCVHVGRTFNECRL